MELAEARHDGSVERVLRRYCRDVADMENLADAMQNGELRLYGNARLTEDAEQKGRRCLELDGVQFSPDDVLSCTAWMQGMALAEGMGWI